MPWQLGTTSDLFQTVRKHCARGVNHLLFRPWNKCKNCGRTKASNRSRTFVYISPIVCSLAIGLYLCLPGSDHPGCAEDLLKNVKHCHPHHILDRRQREENERESLEGEENKVTNNDTRISTEKKSKMEHFKRGLHTSRKQILGCAAMMKLRRFIEEKMQKTNWIYNCVITW